MLLFNTAKKSAYLILVSTQFGFIGLKYTLKQVGSQVLFDLLDVAGDHLVYDAVDNLDEWKASHTKVVEPLGIDSVNDWEVLASEGHGTNNDLVSAVLWHGTVVVVVVIKNTSKQHNKRGYYCVGLCQY